MLQGNWKQSYCVIFKVWKIAYVSMYSLLSYYSTQGLQLDHMLGSYLCVLKPPIFELFSSIFSAAYASCHRKDDGQEQAAECMLGPSNSSRVQLLWVAGMEICPSSLSGLDKSLTVVSGVILCFVFAWFTSSAPLSISFTAMRTRSILWFELKL